MLGFLISSPMFLTNIFSPSFAINSSVPGVKDLKTPVILNSTFLVRSPFSYPKTVSVDLTSEADEISSVTPEHPKN